MNGKILLIIFGNEKSVYEKYTLNCDHLQKLNQENLQLELSIQL